MLKCIISQGDQVSTMRQFSKVTIKLNQALLGVSNYSLTKHATNCQKTVTVPRMRIKIGVAERRQ